MYEHLQSLANLDKTIEKFWKYVIIDLALNRREMIYYVVEMLAVSAILYGSRKIQSGDPLSQTLLSDFWGKVGKVWRLGGGDDRKNKFELRDS